VRERRVLDGLVLGREPTVVLALMLLPGPHLELLHEQVGALSDAVEVPPGGAAAES
jgi:hypothetical protein